jgi:DNA-binding MarR family transcriptional regulator
VAATDTSGRDAAQQGVTGAPGAGEPTPELTALGDAFRHLYRAVSRMRGRDTHLGGSEISHAQFELLIELDDRGELSAGELALVARLSPASVTQMLDQLAVSGHVERVRSQTDRRVVVTRLTAQGRRKVRAKRAAWKGRWQRALAGLGPADLAAATVVLERLAAMLDDPPPETGA